MTTEDVCDVSALSVRVDRSTVSRILMIGNAAEPERVLLRKWAEYAAANGGSFAVRNEWTENQWYTTWTINWPCATPNT
jgi:hypothetical protein